MTYLKDFGGYTPVVFSDARLSRAFYSNGLTCASVNEYSTTTGIPVLELLDMLDEQIAKGNMGLEFCGGEVFVNTAINGRTPSTHLPPNLWEIIRKHGDVDYAYEVWLTGRELELAGWSVEYDLYKVTGNPGIAVHFAVSVGLKMGQFVVPLLECVNVDSLAVAEGPLDYFAQRNYSLIGVRCRNGQLDASVTAIRTWYMHNEDQECSGIVLLEEPHDMPLLLLKEDGGLEPRSISVR